MERKPEPTIRRALAVMLSIALATGGVPASAVAETSDETAGTVSVASPSEGSSADDSADVAQSSDAVATTGDSAAAEDVETTVGAAGSESTGPTTDSSASTDGEDSQAEAATALEHVLDTYVNGGARLVLTGGDDVVKDGASYDIPHTTSSGSEIDEISMLTSDDAYTYAYDVEEGDCVSAVGARSDGRFDIAARPTEATTVSVTMSIYASDTATSAIDASTATPLATVDLELTIEPSSDASAPAAGPEDTVASETPTATMAAKAVASQVSASFSVIGAEADGTARTWASTRTYELPEGSTAADLSEQALSAAGLSFDASSSAYGWHLSSITSPDGLRSLGWDAVTGRYWQLFVNGEAATVGASSYVLQPGDRICWYYSSYGETLPASCSFIGRDASGQSQVWASSDLLETGDSTSAWDASREVLDQAGLAYEAFEYDGSAYLSSVTSPDGTLRLGWDQDTGRYWQLWVNGEYATESASSVSLGPGDRVTWYYASDEEAAAGLPDADESSDATDDQNGSDGDASTGTDAAGTVDEFHDNAGLAPSGATTPTKTVGSTDWSTLVGGGGRAVSEPLLYEGKIVVAYGNTLSLLSNDSGGVSVERSMTLDYSMNDLNYTCRPAISGDVVYVPLSRGRVEAVSLDTFERLWTSEATGDTDQNSCSVRVVSQDGRSLVVYGTASFDGTGYGSGSVVALDALTGEAVWSQRSSESGFYFTGAATSGGYVLMGDTAGTLRSYDADGNVRGTLSLGSGIYGDVVSYGDGVLVVTSDGTLHKVRVAEDGGLADVSSVRALARSVSAPSLSGDLAVLTGAGLDGTSAISVVDLTDMTSSLVDSTETGALDGNGSYAPALLVSQSGGLYAYFTVNAASGCAYVYRVGDDHATLLYDPATTWDRASGTYGHADYCDSPLVADALGNLYYINDSGYLVRIPAGGGGEATRGNDADDGTGEAGEGAGESRSSDTRGGGASTSLSGQLSSHIALSSNVSASSGRGALALLDGIGSDTLTGTVADVLGEDSGQVSDATRRSAAGELPIWPLVGMMCGGAVLVGTLVWRHRDDSERSGRDV